MNEGTPSPKLAEPLDFRLRFGGDWSKEDLASLRRSLKTDPRTKLLILRHLEFAPRYAELYCDEKAMLGMLLEEFPDCAAARYLLHRGAFVEFGHEGDTGETCHDLMEHYDPDHPHFRQIVIRCGPRLHGVIRLRGSPARGTRQGHGGCGRSPGCTVGAP